MPELSNKKFFMKIKLPVLILGIVVCVFLFGPNIPTEVVAFFYTISTVVKDIVSFFIPIVVLPFIAYLLADLHEGTFLFVFRLFGTILLSNILVTIYAYGAFELFYPLLDIGKSDLCVEKLTSKIETFVLKYLFHHLLKVVTLYWGVILEFFCNAPKSTSISSLRKKCVISVWWC